MTNGDRQKVFSSTETFMSATSTQHLPVLGFRVLFEGVRNLLDLTVYPPWCTLVCFGDDNLALVSIQSPQLVLIALDEGQLVDGSLSLVLGPQRGPLLSITKQ